MTLPPARRLAHAARVVAFALAALVAASGGAACSSPEDVVGHAVEAAASGDLERYAGAFTPRSRPLLDLYYGIAAASRPELGQLTAGDVQVTGVQPLPPDTEGRERVMVTVREGTQTARLVLHRQALAWRIDLIDTERGTLGYGLGF